MLHIHITWEMLILEHHSPKLDSVNYKVQKIGSSIHQMLQLINNDCNFYKTPPDLGIWVLGKIKWLL